MSDGPDAMRAFYRGFALLAIAMSALLVGVGIHLLGLAERIAPARPAVGTWSAQRGAGFLLVATMLLVAGMGMLRRREWGIRLAIASLLTAFVVGMWIGPMPRAAPAPTALPQPR